MCEYCGRKERDLARIDLEDDNNAFAYVNIMENRMRLVVETDHWDDDMRIEAKYCPMCGRELEEKKDD